MNGELRVDIAAALAAIDQLLPCLDKLERQHSPAADKRLLVGLSSGIRNLDALSQDLQAWRENLLQKEKL